MTLFEQCIEVLGNDTKIFSEFETQNLGTKFTEMFPMRYILNKYVIGIDWDSIKVKKNLNGDISRLKDDPFPIFISQRLKLAIECNNLTGFGFLEVKVT